MKTKKITTKLVASLLTLALSLTVFGNGVASAFSPYDNASPYTDGFIDDGSLNSFSIFSPSMPTIPLVSAEEQVSGEHTKNTETNVKDGDVKTIATYTSPVHWDDGNQVVELNAKVDCELNKENCEVEIELGVTGDNISENTVTFSGSQYVNSNYPFDAESITVTTYRNVYALYWYLDDYGVERYRTLRDGFWEKFNVDEAEVNVDGTSGRIQFTFNPSETLKPWNPAAGNSEFFKRYPEVKPSFKSCPLTNNVAPCVQIYDNFRPERSTVSFYALYTANTTNPKDYAAATFTFYHRYRAGDSIARDYPPVNNDQAIVDVNLHISQENPEGYNNSADRISNANRWYFGQSLLGGGGNVLFNELNAVYSTKETYEEKQIKDVTQIQFNHSQHVISGEKVEYLPYLKSSSKGTRVDDDGNYSYLSTEDEIVWSDDLSLIKSVPNTNSGEQFSLTVNGNYSGIEPGWYPSRQSPETGIYIWDSVLEKLF